MQNLRILRSGHHGRGRFVVALLVLLAACTPAPPPPVDGTWTREPSRVPDTPGAPTPAPPPTAAPEVTAVPEPEPVPHAELLDNEDGQAHYFGGVARVDLGEPCTGVLIGTDPAAPAYVLTSGRCTGTRGANDVLIDAPITRGSVTFNYFAYAPEQRLEVPVRRIAYATTKGTDLAVLELETTLRALAARGITPWPVADAAPERGMLVSIVAAPVESFAESEAYLRRSICTLEEQVDVVAGPWHWFDAYRNTCPDVLGGSAGAPVFDSRDGSIVGLVAATAVRAATDECDFHRPCEATAAGMRSVSGASYAVSVAGVARCLDTRGVFALQGGACPLDDGQQVTPEGYPLHAVRPVVTGARGEERPRLWDVTLRGDTYTAYRFKAGPAGVTNCRTLSGYGEGRLIAASGAITTSVPAAEGHYLLCILGGTGPEATATWQDSDRATVVHLLVDTTPPREGPGLRLEADAEGYRFFLTGSPPELASFGVKMGDPDRVDCDAPEGYAPLRGDWFAMPHPRDTVQVCIVGYDEAGNPGEPIALPLG